MNSRPILFSAPMVRALLDGSKTQTRRIAKVEKTLGHESISGPRNGKYARVYFLGKEHDLKDIAQAFPYGQPGDRLWVREAWSHDAESLEQCRASYEDAMGPGRYGPYYRATEKAPDTLFWKPSIHMPRWASRITLEITAVRLERLQDISEADAQAEGVYTDPACPAYEAYEALWEEINGAGTWAINPWVWVIEFKVVKP